ncbi:YihY/virulence factor BrkB family protein [Fructobacillus ficulneus]|uniref:YihY/virulence factor BrkB family protein n=1 Tax=Fructobacillus ficulneus TaxID=157463 RepID=UPI000783B4B6|nr:YihY/virulence factor BrkB family protein [Fructobacillus ficulneus]
MKERVTNYWNHLDQRYRAKSLVKYFSRAQFAFVGPTFAYYVVLTLIPLLIMFVLAISAMNLNTARVIGALSDLLPTSISNFLIPLVDSVAHTNTNSYLSLSLIFIVWSLSQVTAVLRRAFNHIAGVDEVGLSLLTRAWAFLWMIVMLVVTVSVMFIGNIFAVFFYDWTGMFFLISPNRWLVLFAIWIILIWLNYRVPAPAARPSILAVLVGTLIDVILVSGLNKVFVALANVQFHRSSVSQSLASMAVFLIWLNLLATILIIGFVLMTWLTEFPWFRKRSKKSVLKV